MPQSPMTVALSNIYATIPMPILEAAFEPGRYQTSLDERIIEEVIEKRVLLATNLMTGKMTKIPLLAEYEEPALSPIYSALGTSYSECVIYRIPPHLREHKNIASVSNTFMSNMLGGWDSNLNGIFSDPSNTLANLSYLAVESRTLNANSVMPKPILLADNMIKVMPRIFGSNLVLDCKLEYDSEYTNLSSDAIFWLKNLVLCATKTYIYTNLILKIDANEIINGQPLGMIRSIVEKYEGEEEKYDDMVIRFKGACDMDPESIKQIMMMGI